MTRGQATAKLQRVHTHLRGKAEVLETLALKVLRGDEDLGSALRLKAEELQNHLLRYTVWEEDQLIPLLTANAASGSADSARMLTERRRQRLQLSRSLVALQSDRQSTPNLAKECLVLVNLLEAAIAEEERDVMPSLTSLRMSGV